MQNVQKVTGKNKIAIFNTTVYGCIYSFLNITRSMHKMTEQEIRVASLFLYYHHLEKCNFVREIDLWKHLFDYSTKLKIKEQIGITDAGLQNVLTSLRKKGVIDNNKFKSYYLLDIDKEDDEFQIVFKYKFKKDVKKT